MKGMFIYDTHNFIIRLFTDKTTGSCRCIYGSCHRRKFLLSFPVAGSKCAPVQHIINILGRHVRALVQCRNCILCQPVTKSAWSWQHDGFSRKYGWSTLLWTCILHLPQAQPDLSCRGTRHRNSWRHAAYPVAVYIMGITPAGIFVYVVPFLISTIAGSILAFLLITALNKGGVMAMIKTTR